MRSILAPLLAVVAVGGWAGSAPATEGSPTVVEVEADRFEPDRIEIEAGATVEWRNVATVGRSVWADDGSFVSGRLRPGKSFLVTFAEPGEYPYHGAVGGRMPLSPAGLVVVHAPGTIGQEDEPPGEDAEPPYDQPDGEDPEDPADEVAPTPPEQAAPPWVRSLPGRSDPWIPEPKPEVSRPSPLLLRRRNPCPRDAPRSSTGRPRRA
jgi:plastocyanin